MATDATVSRWRRNPSLLSGAVILGLLLVVALVAPPLLSGSAETLTDDARLGPGAGHLLGTDAFGRDVLARALVATRLTLLMAAAATAASFVAGVAIGALVHLAPGWLRETCLRLIDNLSDAAAGGLQLVGSGKSEARLFLKRGALSRDRRHGRRDRQDPGDVRTHRDPRTG